MSLTKAAVDMLGAKLADDNVEGPLTPTGMTKGPRGTIIVNPSTSSPRTAKTGPLVDPEGQVIQNQPQQMEQPVKKGRKRKQESAPAPKPLVKATVIVNGMSIPTQYAHINKGNGVLVLWLTEFSFVPQPAMKDADGNITNKVQLEGYEGEWANLGQMFTDRDGTRCMLLWQM